MLQAGDRISDWVVESTLGEGGMGAVFRCHNAMTERITAAVKVMKPDRVEDIRDRFLREVESLDGLNHPAIVRVKGWGEDETRGLLWLAMDLVEGEDLSVRLRRGSMPVEEVVTVFTTLAEGLAHAHEQGICHRDIKPANLLLSEGGARLVDFGIAVDSGRTRMTAVGQIPGTPAYLGPEVFRGKPQPVSLDIYALGQVLCESLTGKQAFPEQPTLGTTQRLANLMGQKMQSGPLDPGDGVPEHLRQLCRRATWPVLAGRIQTMADFVAMMKGEEVIVPDFGAPETMDFSQADLLDLPDPVEVSEPPAPVTEPESVRVARRDAEGEAKPAPVVGQGAGGGIRMWVAAALFLLMPAVFAGGYLATRPPTQKNLNVVVAGLAPGTPVFASLGGATPVALNGFSTEFPNMSTVLTTSVRVWGGALCSKADGQGETCGACCACMDVRVEPEQTVAMATLNPPASQATVRLTIPKVDQAWDLAVNVDGRPGEAVAHGTRVFGGLSAGIYAVRVDAGECPDEAAGCWPDGCPDGCSSYKGELVVPCGESEVAFEVGLDNPVAVDKKPLFKAIAGLKGLRVRVIHKRGDDLFAQKAARRLRPHGVHVETHMAASGWGQYDGKVSLFNGTTEEQAASVRKLLRSLGYLDQKAGKGGDSDEIDIAMWLTK